MTDVEAKLSQTLSTSRIQNLVDGVFATAMTFMLFNLHIPANFPSENLSTLLIQEWPELFTFFLSMFVLGSFWVGHHNEAHWIRHSDRTYLWINILFLSFIVLLPFSTSIVANYYNEPLAVAIYGMNLMICGFILYLHWTYATKNRRLVDPDLPDDVIAVMRYRVIIPFVLGLFVIAYAFVSPITSLILYAVLFIPGAIPTLSDKIMKSILGAVRR